MGSLSRVGYAQRVCPSPRPNYFSFIAVSAYTSTAQSPPLSYLQRPFQLYVPSYCQLGIVHILHNHFLVSNWSPQLIQSTTVGKFWAYWLLIKRPQESKGRFSDLYFGPKNYLTNVLLGLLAGFWLDGTVLKNRAEKQTQFTNLLK